MVMKVHKASEVSESLLDVNVPEVRDLTANFVYNHYLKNERVANPFTIDSFGNALPLSKVARYVTLNWKTPSAPPAGFKNYSQLVSTNDAAGKILSEEEFFNQGMITHVFSDVSAITQGASDIENYSGMMQHDTDSVFKMSQYQLKEIKSTSEPTSEAAKTQFDMLTDDFSKLVDFPKTSLGLRVYDSQGNLTVDDDDLIMSLTDSLTLNVKINSAVVPDIFKDSNVKELDKNFDVLKKAYESSKTKQIESESTQIPVVFNLDNTEQGQFSTGNPYSLVGYIVDKYVASPDGFKKEDTFYVEDASIPNLIDKNVLYGLTYLYSFRTVVSVVILTYPDDPSGQQKPVPSAIYISSKPKTVAVECFEYVQPPEPIDIRFMYDHMKKTFFMSWDMPVNPQRDVKQFQVFRRKTINEPFELIAQYGFDDSEVGHEGKRYVTGEKIDANDYDSTPEEYKGLIKYVRDTPTSQPRPTYIHVDEDFVVDTETFTSSEFIYAVCSIDAHGMISNYSTQHQVKFDAMKNRLDSKIVCFAGSPRQYPNMNLKMDAFKDVIRIAGDSARQMSVYFTPEYETLRDSNNTYNKVIMTKKVDPDAHYLLQMINLDNQKLQTLRIDISDTTNKT